MRKSYTATNKIYFWTASINKWYPLLGPDQNKDIIIDSLRFLSLKELITVYAFVLMPTHLHFIWRQNKRNGKESPKGSFMKYTAHTLLEAAKQIGISKLFRVDAWNKKHEIWQRDSLGIEIYSRAVAEQKLKYIHFNPVKGKWKLAKDDLAYHYSSARFYEYGVDEFGFLHNIFDLFD
jgi:REP element-mobilizing transposase RayT